MQTKPRRIQVLPNLSTLANAGCGLLAISKCIDALTLGQGHPEVFYAKMETACALIFLGMIFDSLDGYVARLVKVSSDFGAQLDSFSDALTFGVAPAIMVKVLVEHEPGMASSFAGNARLHFVAMVIFSLMAILRLVRFNLEPEEDGAKHEGFRGLPSPAAAGSVASTMWLYLLLRSPSLESSEGTPTPFSRVLGWMKDVDWSPVLHWVPLGLIVMLPVLGLLMVSNVRYNHGISFLLRKGQFFALVFAVLAITLCFMAPVPFLFLGFVGFTRSGVVMPFVRRRLAARESKA